MKITQHPLHVLKAWHSKKTRCVSICRNSFDGFMASFDSNVEHTKHSGTSSPAPSVVTVNPYLMYSSLYFLFLLCFPVSCEGVALLEACPCPSIVAPCPSAVAVCPSVTLLTKNRSIGASDQLTRH